MSQTERIHQIVHILESSRLPVPIARFLDELEISRATFKRDIEYLRDRLGAPIEWQRGTTGKPAGYVMRETAGSSLAVRGLWFNQSEIYALLMMHELACSMEPGLVTPHTQALLARIRHLLGSADDDPTAVLSFIRILHSATRRRSTAGFEQVARATVRQRRLRIRYFTRSRNQIGERQVSPQRLLHYRENWYLLAWCHEANDLRLFALDAIHEVEILVDKARRVSQHRLDRAMGSGFGIFGGCEVQHARLRFTAEAARWIVDEIWHPDQRISWDDEQLILEVPYTQQRELAMEIMRHGADVEVLAPPALRCHVAERLHAAAVRYAERPTQATTVGAKR